MSLLGIKRTSLPRGTNAKEEEEDIPLLEIQYYISWYHRIFDIPNQNCIKKCR